MTEITTRKNKIFSFQANPKTMAILANIPLGSKSDHINNAIITVFELNEKTSDGETTLSIVQKMQDRLEKHAKGLRDHETRLDILEAQTNETES